MKYITIIVTLILVTYGQLILKSEVNKLGPIPTGSLNEITKYFISAVSNLWILSGLFAAVFAALAWIATMSKFQLSSVYPLLSLNFVIVPLLSIYLFNESLNLFKIIGIIVIIGGVFIFSRGI